MFTCLIPSVSRIIGVGIIWKKYGKGFYDTKKDMNETLKDLFNYHRFFNVSCKRNIFLPINCTKINQREIVKRNTAGEKKTH